MPPWLRLEPEEYSDGVIPSHAINWRGCWKRSKSPSSASIPTAVVNCTPPLPGDRAPLDKIANSLQLHGATSQGVRTVPVDPRWCVYALQMQAAASGWQRTIGLPTVDGKAPNQHDLCNARHAREEMILCAGVLASDRPWPLPTLAQGLGTPHLRR